MSEFQEISTGFVARNGNPRLWVAKQSEIKGGFHQYNTLEEFIALHPDKMEKGMEVVVNEHSRTNGIFKTKNYKLTSIPDIADFPLSIDPADPNYYLNHWQLVAELDYNTTEYEIEYAPDVNGIKPLYPYISNPTQEVNWSDTYTAGVSKWYRERFSDEVDIGTGIYKYWSIPFPINGNFDSGDYVANLFLRAAVTPPLPSALTDDGLPNNEPSGWTDTPPVGIDPLYEIRAQKDKYGNLKTAWIGPFLIPEDEDLVRYNSQATPNPNTIVGTSTPATESSQADLDLIAAGWVKTYDPTIHNYRAKREENAPNDYTTWVLDKIAEESGEYIDRIYKLFPINTDFDNASFIANNTPTGNDPVSNPTGASENIDWFDIPLSETDTEINCFSQARKFIDGSLKTTWSSPQPFTGKDVYTDYISSNGEVSFKYPSSADAAAGTNSDPTTITLTAFLFKGDAEVTTGLTYKWFKVYDNKTIIPVDPEVDTPLATTKSYVVSPSGVTAKAVFRCYITLAVSGGTDLKFQDEISITDITDGDDAKALVLGADTPVVVYDTVGASFPTSVIRLRARQNFLDATTFYWYKDDGAGNWLDLTVFASGSITAFADAGGGQVTVTSTAHGLSNGEAVNITGTTNYNGNYEITNVATDTFEITATWVATETGSWDQDFYTLANQLLEINTSDLFVDDGAAESARFAISTSSSTATVEDVNEFYDVATVSKLGSAGVGADGAAAYTLTLSNEVDSVILDVATDQPIAGEIGSTGRIKTLLKIFEGTTKLDYTTDWTITSIVSDTVNVTFGHQANGTDREIYIDTWTSTTARKVNGTINITANGLSFVRNFTISSTLDSAGALIAYIAIDSTSVNQNLAFTPEQRNDIKLKALLDQNGTLISSANFDGNVVWKFGNTPTATNLSGTNNENKTVTRADVVGSVSVKAEIPYNGNTYIAVPVNIDDITDAKTYRLFYNYAAAYDIQANEPLATPAVPSDTAVSDFESTFALSGATTDWYRQAGSKTYFITEGIVSVVGGIDTIQFQPAYRNRGEFGDQGPSPDFLVTYYKGTATSTPPTITPSNASRDTMLANGWLPSPNGISDAYIWQASTTFDGSNIDITSALAAYNWGVVRYNTIDGKFYERRYQGSQTQSFTGFDNANRNAGTGWTVTKPSVLDFNYIYETSVYINPDGDVIVGNWTAPVIIAQGTNTITSTLNEINDTYLPRAVADKKYVSSEPLEAITDILSGTINSGDATTDNIIANLRTIVQELTDRLERKNIVNNNTT